MSDTDLTKPLKSKLIDLNNMTEGMKEQFYLTFFSSQTNTASSFDHKLELLRLVCILTQKLKKGFPDEFCGAKDVLLKYVYQNQPIELYGDREFITSLWIKCDDLLYGVDEITVPEQFKNTRDIRERILELIAEWLPI